MDYLPDPWDMVREGIGLALLEIDITGLERLIDRVAVVHTNESGGLLFCIIVLGFVAVG